MSDNAPPLHLLRCHLAANAYAFDASKVRAIHRWESVQREPQSAGAIGVLAGKPVYPLARLLGLDEDAAASEGPVLLLDDCAIQVDRISRPAPVAESGLRCLPRPALAAHGRVHGLARIDGELTLLLDPARLRDPSGAPAVPPWPADEAWSAPASSTTDKLLCFLPPGHGTQTYFAVSYRQAVEVAQGLTLRRLRSGEPWLAGLVDWRDRAVPVVDLAGLLGIGPSPTVETARVLIARSPRSGELFALPATQLAPLPLPLGDDSMVLETIDPPTPFVRAAYALTEGFLFIPDLERLVAQAAG